MAELEADAASVVDHPAKPAGCQPIVLSEICLVERAAEAESTKCPAESAGEPKADSEDRPAQAESLPEVETMTVEVLLMSGKTLASLRLHPRDRVSKAMEAAVEAAAGAGLERKGALRLVLGDRLLDASGSLGEQGVQDGAALTAVWHTAKWNQQKHGKSVVFEEDGLVAKRSEGFYDAVVFTCHPARHVSVRIRERISTWSGGLEIGFCARAPEELEDIPGNANYLPDSWASTNCGGCSWAQAETRYWKDGANANEKLQVDDVVTCRVTDNGGMVITVNDEVVADWPGTIPTDIDLYPVVGIYGQAVAVELLS